jgi:hypothetical protein
MELWWWMRGPTEVKRNLCFITSKNILKAYIGLSESSGAINLAQGQNYSITYQVKEQGRGEGEME